MNRGLISVIVGLAMLLLSQVACGNGTDVSGTLCGEPGTVIAVDTAGRPSCAR